MLTAQDFKGVYGILATPAKVGADRWDATDTVDMWNADDSTLMWSA